MYNLQLLSSREEVDFLLRMAARDKRAANLLKDSLALRNENATDSEANRSADILSAQSEIASLDALIKSLPEGQRKESEITKKMAAEVRLRRLTQGNAGESPATIAERSYDADLSEREVAGIDAFIAALEIRKSEIG